VDERLEPLASRARIELCDTAELHHRASVIIEGCPRADASYRSSEGASTAPSETSPRRRRSGGRAAARSGTPWRFAVSQGAGRANGDIDPTGGDDPVMSGAPGFPLSVVGHPLPKVDAWSKVTGETRYADDLVFPRMAHAKILR